MYLFIIKLILICNLLVWSSLNLSNVQPNTPKLETHSTSPPAVILMALHEGLILPVDVIFVHWLKTNLESIGSSCPTFEMARVSSKVSEEIFPLQRSMWLADDHISGLSLDLFIDFLFSPLCCVTADRKCHRYTQHRWLTS